MDDHVNLLLSPLTPGFATGRFVGVAMWGFVSPILPPVGGELLFSEMQIPTSARTWGSGH